MGQNMSDHSYKMTETGLEALSEIALPSGNLGTPNVTDISVLLDVAMSDPALSVLFDGVTDLSDLAAMISNGLLGEKGTPLSIEK